MESQQNKREFVRVEKVFRRAALDKKTRLRRIEYRESSCEILDAVKHRRDSSEVKCA